MARWKVLALISGAVLALGMCVNAVIKGGEAIGNIYCCLVDHGPTRLMTLECPAWGREDDSVSITAIVLNEGETASFEFRYWRYDQNRRGEPICTTTVPIDHLARREVSCQIRTSQLDPGGEQIVVWAVSSAEPFTLGGMQQSYRGACFIAAEPEGFNFASARGAAWAGLAISGLLLWRVLASRMSHASKIE